MGDNEGDSPAKPSVPEGLPDAAPEAFPGEDRSVRLVGLGGSAGSLAPLQEFFSRMPADTGMAFVVVVHLAPEHESILAEILQRSTPMRVAQVTGEVAVEPDHVYVIPPARHLVLTDGRLHLSSVDGERGRRSAIDLFFRSLADTHGSKAVAVVLSGADGDGALGIKRIKEQGGLAIAQDPRDAEYRGMPAAAIQTGLVDWILPAREMASRIVEYQTTGQRLQLPPVEGGEQKVAPGETDLRDILGIVRARTRRDFSGYKRGTLLRRISRRMQVNGTASLAAYHDFLRNHPEETGRLVQDLLISVTNFFRDAEAYGAVEALLPELFKDKGPSDAVRVWVAGCATGEEAYSLAVLLAEYASQLPAPPKLQLFATDIDEPAIAAARAAYYPESIATDVSEERLRRFFVRQPHGYRVSAAVRETVLFALHDLIKDAPFSRLDLVSCRNVLIYFSRETQTRLVEIFHFALRPDGLLLLGTSESADEGSELFGTEDKKNRLYRKQPVRRLNLPLPIGPLNLASMVPGTEPAASTARPPTDLGLPLAVPPVAVNEMHFRLLERLAPPSLVVNRNNLIVHLSPSVGRFLKVSGGEPTADLLALSHPMLRLDLRAALFRARETNAPADMPAVPVELEGELRAVYLTARPLEDVAPGYLLVVFGERDPTLPGASQLRPAPAQGVVRALERELDETKQQLLKVREQHSAATEDMKASNEELQAMNEELRSASEELETGREELQSVNEELITVNQDLKAKVDDLARSNSDLQNLMAATNIATVFLDRELRIQRYTPTAVTFFSLIASDIGRPLFDLRHRLEMDTVLGDAQAVLRTGEPVERETRAANGRWYLARLLPYRSAEEKVVGVVLTFIDITERRASEEALVAAKVELEQRVEDRTAALAEVNRSLSAEMAVRASAEKSREELRHLLVVAQEDERGRISRGLHDEIGQQITALLLGLKSLAPALAADPRAKNALQSLYAMAENVGRDIHEVALELRPTALDDLGLVRSLGAFLEEWSRRTHLKVEFDHQAFGQERLPRPLETVLYRVIAEAAHNVFKHAGASRVGVILQRQAERVVAMVEDDGAGFDLAALDRPQKPPRLGIESMRERAALVDGEMSIESEPGRGTTVIFRLPLGGRPA